MGEVWKAEDTQLRRTVALKFLSSEAVGEEEANERLIREAQASASLDHPNICHVYGIHQENGETFIAMAYVDGPSLADAIRERPLPLDEALDIAIQIAEGLQEAHSKGVIHRDIKPHNVMLTSKGQVKVMDFGLARLEDRSRLTKTGTTLGTPAYMAPEQLEGLTVDRRADIWALGCVVYEMFAQKNPFDAEYRQAIAYGIFNEDPEPLTSLRSGLPIDLDRVVAKLLAKSLESRYQHIDDVLVDLRTLRSQPARSAKGPASAVRTPPSATEKVGPMSVESVPAPSPLPVTLATRPNVVGRESEMEALREALHQVSRGGSLFVNVIGETGLGKTTLLNEFLVEVSEADDSPAVARGQCSERLAGSEAYLPLFDGLESLLANHPRLCEVMRRLAPWWYVRANSAIEDDPSVARLHEAAMNATQERVKRELAAFFREASQLQPLVFVVEDLHWSDVSSVDMLAYLAARFAEMRVLFAATYRPAEMTSVDHPFLKIRPDLLARGQLREVQLRNLTEIDVEQYLSLGYPGHAFPAAFARLLALHTQGSPLFLVDLLRDLTDRGTLVEEAGTWRLSQPVDSLSLDLPASIEAMIRQKVESLAEDDVPLLAAACVQGFSFDSAVVAAVAGLDEEEVEERLQKLDRVHRFVRFVEETEHADGTPSLRYQFVHVLYQNELYRSMSRIRRIRTSRAAAEALESFCANRLQEAASELAQLYEASRDFLRALHYYELAVQQLQRVFAFREAEMVANRGIQLVPSVAETPERDRHELALYARLGAVLIATKGSGDESVATTFSEVLRLTEKIGSVSCPSWIMGGLSNHFNVTCQIERNRRLLEQYMGPDPDGDRLAFVGLSMGIMDQFEGEHNSAARNLKVGLDTFGAFPILVRRGMIDDIGSEPVVWGLGHLALNSWILGFADSAANESREAERQSEELESPQAAVHYFGFAGFLYQGLRYPERVLELSDRCIRVSTENGFLFNEIWARAQRGWALAWMGDPAEGLEMMRRGLEAWHRSGTVCFVPFWQAHIAEIILKLGRIDEARLLLNDTLRTAEETGHRMWEPELHRLSGELLLSQAADATEVEQAFEQALSVAKQQEAKSLELRAAVSLARFWARTGNRERTRQLLSSTYEWFSEGFDTRDLRQAKALLEEISS